jgi:hypothetical protein
VRGSHLTRPIIEVFNFTEQGLEIAIDGEVIDPENEIELVTGEVYELEVVATQDEFRGCLIRLEALDDQSAAGALTPGANARPAQACIPQGPSVVGVTHFNSDLKTIFSGLLLTEEAGRFDVGITVVVSNNAEESVFGYLPLSLSFVDAASEAPSEQPSEQPSEMPSDAPSDVPSAFPTGVSDEPSAAPSDVPSDAPSDAPSDQPSEMPSDLPTIAPFATEQPVPKPPKPPKAPKAKGKGSPKLPKLPKLPKVSG